MSVGLLSWVTRFASRLRFPWLFAVTAAVFLLDLVVPDVIPLADEILLGLVTVLLGSLRRDGGRRPARAEGEDRPLPPPAPPA